MRSNFSCFKSDVVSKGGIWEKLNDVYFSQTRDAYYADYLPAYPEKSEHDQTLSYNHVTNMWSHTSAKEA